MKIDPLISIIVPCYNETPETLKKVLEHIRKNAAKQEVEILVSDAPNSRFEIDEICLHYGAKYLKASKACRAVQMNEAAKVATADIYYFVHADTLIHPNFLNDIVKFLLQGYHLGCYRFRFDRYHHPLLYLNSFFTRFPFIWCRGGDQSLFIQKAVFNDLKGFDAELKIMEDYDILQRASVKYRFKLIPKSILVSARKYQNNTYWNVQLANLMVMRLWLKGNRDTDFLLNYYRQKLK